MNTVIFTVDGSFRYTHYTPDAHSNASYQFNLEADIDSSLLGERKQYSEDMQGRHLFLMLQNYIRQTMVLSDVVIVLHGVDALLAMKAPGGDGMICSSLIYILFS
jgi:hypothetical protein